MPATAGFDEACFVVGMALRLVAWAAGVDVVPFSLALRDDAFSASRSLTLASSSRKWPDPCPLRRPEQAWASKRTHPRVNAAMTVTVAASSNAFLAIILKLFGVLRKPGRLGDVGIYRMVVSGLLWPIQAISCRRSRACPSTLPWPAVPHRSI